MGALAAIAGENCRIGGTTPYACTNGTCANALINTHPSCHFSMASSAWICEIPGLRVRQPADRR